MAINHQRVFLSLTRRVDNPDFPGCSEQRCLKLNSHQGCHRRANQRLHLGRNEVSDWLDARHSTFVRLDHSQEEEPVGWEGIPFVPEDFQRLQQGRSYRRIGLIKDTAPKLWAPLNVTATAGSDVVQSGRPIFDDFFQHLWPYIGNNTANVVFQMVKRLWLIRIDQ
ncbi:hypothetical protein TNCV_4134851 [Trichonephila clavipes]|nr:hypothetical protein TNCV_4134851 [Trichonephila clavipes]